MREGGREEIEREGRWSMVLYACTIFLNLYLIEWTGPDRPVVGDNLYTGRLALTQEHTHAAVPRYLRSSVLVWG